MGLVKAKIGLRPKALALCFLLLPLASPCWLLRLASSCLLLLPFSSRSSASASVSMLPACFSFSPCCSLSALAACILFSNALPLAVGRGPRILAPSCSPCLQVFSFFPFTEILLLALLLWRAPPWFPGVGRYHDGSMMARICYHRWPNFASELLETMGNGQNKTSCYCYVQSPFFCKLTTNSSRRNKHFCLPNLQESLLEKRVYQDFWPYRVMLML